MILVCVAPPAGAPGPFAFQIVPLEFFRDSRGGLTFDLQHASEEAAAYMVANDPEHWRIV